MIIGVTRESVQRNIINDLCDILGAGIVSSKTNEMTVFGRKLYIIGANDESAVRRIQGSTLALAYVDEIAVVPQPFVRMLLSRLSKPGAQLLATCNPEGPHHWLKTDFIDRAKELGLAYWQFELDDNPSLGEKYKEALKREYTGHWYARFILGQWAVAQGLVYDCLTDDNIYTETTQNPEYYIGGIDYGITNPTAAVMIGVEPRAWPQLCVEKEYYFSAGEESRQKTDAELADDLHAFFSTRNMRAIYIDPSAASLKLELQRRNMPMVSAKNDVLEGIKVVSKFISQKNLLIHSDCKNLIKELHSYSWDPKAANRGIDKVLKTHDHISDSTRYALYSHFTDGEILHPSDNLSIEEIRRQAYGGSGIDSLYSGTGASYR